MSDARELLDCDSFIQFCDDYGTHRSENALERIEDAAWQKQDINDVEFSSITSLDREGANHRLEGKIIVDDEIFLFSIDSGNWNGTIVRSWIREGLTTTALLKECINIYNKVTR